MTVSPLADEIHDFAGRRVADGSIVIIEVRGSVHGSNIGELADYVRRLVLRRCTSIAVDLCDVPDPDHWLVSALAKAHAAARARGATLRAIVGDDTTLTLLDTAGFGRTVSIFPGRGFQTSLDALVPAVRRSRESERQLAIDRRTGSYRRHRQPVTARTYALSVR